MLRMLYHVMHLLVISPYSKGSISAFSIISCVSDLAHPTSTPTSTGIYPIQSLSPHHLCHAHRQFYGSLTPLIYCLRLISPSSIISIRELAPENVIRHGFWSFTMTKADHSEGGRVTKPMSRREKKAARKNPRPGQSPSKFTLHGTCTIPILSFRGR